MARYCRNYNISVHPEMIFNAMRDYLFREGYEYILLEGEYVFKKEYSFIKFSFPPNVAVIEAWHLPQISQQDVQVVGNRLTCLERMIMNIESQNFQQRQAVIQSRQNVTKGEFFKNILSKEETKGIKSICICAYVLAAPLLVYYCIVQQNLFSIIELLLSEGLVLGMHLGKSRACAIILLVYGCFNVLVWLILEGQVKGYLWLIIAICGLIQLNRMHKAYKQFKLGN